MDSGNLFFGVVSVGVCVVFWLCYSVFVCGWMMLVLRFCFIDVVFVGLDNWRSDYVGIEWCSVFGVELGGKGGVL